MAIRSTLIILLTSLLAGPFCHAQKIKVNETDKFTGKKRVETEYVNAYVGFSNFLAFKFRAVDSACFITLKGTWAVGVVRTDDAVTFLFDDKSTIEILPTSIQTYEIGIGQYASDNYTHQYYISEEQIKTLSQKKIVSIRREYGNHYADIDIKEKNSKKIIQFAAEFYTTIKN